MENTMQVNGGIFLQIATAIILLVAAVLTYYTWKRSKQIGSTYECDRLFMEIEKTLLNNEKLYDFYSIWPGEEKKDWDKMSPYDKRM